MNNKVLIIMLLILIMNTPSYARQEKQAKSVFEQKIEFPQIESSWSQLQYNKISAGLKYNEQFPELDWWLEFDDKYLNEYIEKALIHNPDINIVKINIEEANGIVKSVFANQLPKINIGAGYNRMKFSENFTLPGETSSQGGFFGNGSPINFFNFPLNVSYELDFLGKNFDKTKSAKKMKEAVECQEKAVRISLISQVASSYFNLIESDKLIELQALKVLSLKDVLKMTEAKYEKGFADFNEVELAKINIKENETTLNNLRIQQAAFASQLAILTGLEPSDLTLYERAEWNRTLTDEMIINSGISTELLTRRPDIMAAEARLKSSLIDVKAARKEFLPTIKLNISDLGFMATSFSNVFKSNSFNYIMGGALNQNIFNGGATFANLRIKKAQAERNLQEYRKVILTALKEVEDSFASINNDFDSLKNVEKNKNSSKEILAIQKSKYLKGFVDYIEVRNAEAKYLDNEMLLVKAQSKLINDRVNLYKQLGGGY